MQNNPRRKSIDGFTPQRRVNNQKIFINNQTPPKAPIKSFRKYSYYQNNNPSVASTVIQPVKHKRKIKKKLKKILIGIIIIVLLAAGVFGYNLISKTNKIFHGSVYSDLKSLFTTTKLNGESTGRVNILLAGYQGQNSNEGALTDSIMVISIDTKNNTAFTMSIPRDLYLNVPGVGNEKINAANDVSNFSQPGYFSGGIGELQKTIEQDLNIPINYYAVIDYKAFEDAVNAVGGITVNIQSPDPRGLYDPNVDKAHGGPLRLPNGPVHLNGLTALALALARGDSPYSYGFPLSDINRTQHQRQMLIALEQKALSVGILGNPVAISNLVNAVANNVSTNLTLPDILRLAQLAKIIKISNIKSYGLSYGGQNPLLTTAVIAGQDSLIPRTGLNNFSRIQHYYLSLTSSNPVIAENASIVILNGGNISGLASQEKAALNKVGLNTLSIGNTSIEYSSSMLINLSNNTKPATTKLLTSLLPKSAIVTNSVNGSVEANEGSNYTNADFILILGRDWTNVVN